MLNILLVKDTKELAWVYGHSHALVEAALLVFQHLQLHVIEVELYLGPHLRSLPFLLQNILHL